MNPHLQRGQTHRIPLSSVRCETSKSINMSNNNQDKTKNLDKQVNGIIKL